MLNANKGYQNPMNNYIGRTSEQFQKEKEIEQVQAHVRKPKPVYLYEQVVNGVNVRLAKPV